jgi:hypothetical protein
MATAAGILLLAAGTLAACRYAGEEAVLERFFSAARLHDKTALQSVATVDFDPSVHGIITQFRIVRVTPVEESAGVASKSVTLLAPVQMSNGTETERTVFVTMERRDTKPWIVTGVTVSTSAPAPRPR